MRTVDCPGCGYGFVQRAVGKCRRCGSVLVYPGERFAPLDDDVYILAPSGWIKHPSLRGEARRRARLESELTE